MREQLIKIQEHYHGGQTGAVTSFLTATQPPSQVDLDHALKQWNYSTRLARHMYEVCFEVIHRFRLSKILERKIVKKNLTNQF